LRAFDEDGQVFAVTSFGNGKVKVDDGESEDLVLAEAEEKRG
jgi:hypothetical protein